VGVFIMLMVLDPNELRSDLTPVATAAEAFFHWLPGQVGLMLIVVAALAAFASTGNAGLMSASRYPMAMARDGLFPARFAEVGRFHTPTASILASGALMIACIVLLDVEGIAKLASVFQLLIFSLLCLAVIVMRESRIESYDPGFRSPLYPWIQIAGIVVPFWIITTMGTMSILFSLGLVVLPIGWYFWYAADRVQRDGAIYHWFARLGKRRYAGLDRELRGILKEKGLRSDDPFDEVVARAGVIDADDDSSFDDIRPRAFFPPSCRDRPSRSGIHSSRAHVSAPRPSRMEWLFHTSGFRIWGDPNSCLCGRSQVRALRPMTPCWMNRPTMT